MQAGIHPYSDAGVDSDFRRNDSEAGIKAIRLPVCVYRFVVIPAKAGIQWF